jgi:hypothetical protein
MFVLGPYSITDGMKGPLTIDAQSQITANGGQAVAKLEVVNNSGIMLQAQWKGATFILNATSVLDMQVGQGTCPPVVLSVIPDQTGEAGSLFANVYQKGDPPINIAPTGFVGILTGGLSITTTSLPTGTATESYAATLNASGGKPPYTWSVYSGALPSGLSLASDGAITGTPTASSSEIIGFEVTDSNGVTAQSLLSLLINPLGVSSIPYVRQVSGTGEYEITTTTLTISNVNLTAGDIGALFITTAQDSTSYPTISSVTDSGGNSWKVTGAEGVSNGTTATTIWWWTSTITNTLVNGTITVTFNAAPVSSYSGNTLVLSISSQGISMHGTSTGNSTATSSGSLTVALADLVVDATVFDNSSNAVVWSDVVCASSIASGVITFARDFYNWQMAAAWCVVNNAGTTALTGTLSGSTYWASLGVVYPPPQ